MEGYVSNVDFQIGTQAVANTPLLALVDSNSFWVFGYFRESQIGKFSIGDPARVTLMAYPDSPLIGPRGIVGLGYRALGRQLRRKAATQYQTRFSVDSLWPSGYLCALSSGVFPTASNCALA